MTRFQQVRPEAVESVLATLAAWEPKGRCGAGLQAGDLGWMHRLGIDHVVDHLIVGTDDSGATRLILCMESDTDWWFAIDPRAVMDMALASAFGEWIDQVAPARPVALDGPAAPAVWRQALAIRGFEAVDDPWAQLWMPLEGREFPPVEGVHSTSDPTQIPDRVAVQRAAFERSTFTVERWHEMARCSKFDPRFDLLARNDDGEPVAAATFWFAGAGMCARLEPMGTHPEHRRQGHGRRLIAAAARLIAEAGASGISVTTPMSNLAAVALYRAAGFRLLGTSTAMIRSS